MMRPVVMILSMVAILAAVGGCSSESKGTLYVYCDKVLEPAMTEIVKKFESKSGYTVKLFSEQEDRACKQMMLSNHKDMYISMIPALVDQTVSQGLGKNPETICHIVPTMVTAPLNPRGIDSIEDFRKADIRFGICEEDTFLGETTRRLLEKNGFTGEEVHDLLHQLASDEACLIEDIQNSMIDVGVVWCITARHAERVGVAEITPRKNVRLPVVAMELKESEHPEVTAKLKEFMRSPEAGAIWEKSGLEPCGAAE